MRADNDFLKAGGVFDDDQIEAYIELKEGREHPLRAHPAPGRIRHVLLGLSWTPPAEMRVRARKKGVFLPDQLDGGRNNPLGARALYLYKNGKDTLYRIHGTNEPWNLGQAVTSGCIRMLNHHVADLYKRVKIGTTVIVM
jgi:lipoprotein-anchoring transpeptidase ErfK/SrfK